MKREHLDYRATSPPTIGHMVGQSQVVKQVQMALDAVWNAQIRFPHALMTGPPGLGKTEVARVIALETASKLHEVLGQELRRGPHLAGFLLSLDDGEIVFIDEVHELSAHAQTQLYGALSDGRVSVCGGPFDSTPQLIEVPRFTLLAATTDEYRLAKPLRDRFQLSLQFSLYSVEDIATILEQRTKRMGLAVEPAAIDGMAKRARGTPREALRLLRDCITLGIGRGQSQVTVSHLIEICAMRGVDDLGLDPNQQAYLRRLADHGGAARLHVIAKLLTLPIQTITHVIEPFLVQAALIDLSDGVRRLSDRGKIHVKTFATP